MVEPDEPLTKGCDSGRVALGIKSDPLTAATLAGLQHLARQCTNARAANEAAARHFITTAYAIGRAWEQVGQAKVRSGLLARAAGKGCRIDQSTFHVLISAASDKSRQQCCREANALAFANAQNVDPADLQTFFTHHGGINKCARAWTAHLRDEKWA